MTEKVNDLVFFGLLLLVMPFFTANLFVWHFENYNSPSQETVSEFEAQGFDCYKDVNAGGAYRCSKEGDFAFLEKNRTRTMADIQRQIELKENTKVED